MRQAKLDRYFPSQGASPIPRRNYFVELPFKVRRQIYYEAGLAPNQYIDLNYWADTEIVDEWECKIEAEFETASDYHDHEDMQTLQRERGYKHWDRHAYSESLSLPLHLLLICRTTHLDVTSLVYSTNIFAISQHEPGGLGALENLSTSALKVLRILIVNLNDCSSKRRRKSTLGSKSRADRMILEQWKRICTRFSAHVPPQQLRLCLICDCSDLQTAREVAEISSTLPILQDCAIRFSMLRDEKLTQLAKYTALHLTGRDEPVLDPFRFLDLPREIQFQILKYTDLIATQILEWSPGWPPQINPQPCDRSTSSELDIEASPHFSPELLGRQKSEDLFLCTQWAASAFSPHCTCEIFSPAPYFLVNHEFRNLAAETFYSENHFILFYKNRFSKLVQASTVSPPLLTFLNSIPTGAIAHLTKLTLVFPPFEPTYLQPSQEVWKGWINGIEMLSRHASLQKLKLEIYFTDYHWHHVPDREYEKDVVAAYERIMQPLTVLRALRCLDVHVSWPIGDRALERRKLEDRLEKNIMGEGYDGKKAGKSPVDMYWWETSHFQDSQGCCGCWWQRDYLRGPMRTHV